MSEITRILSAVEQGHAQASRQLFAIVYEELRRLARQRVARESPDQTLCGTALVHEAFIRLVDVGQATSWESRGHFFAAAAEAMRRILIDRARQKKGPRRGGGRPHNPLRDSDLITDPGDDNLLALDEALTALAARHPQAAELVKLRFFAGLSVEDASRVVGVSSRTARRTWNYARAWLRREMDAGDQDVTRSGCGA
jgi:RNA polymerase sigma factor (TIGR02999 family)